MKELLSKAYAPYSHFKVLCIIRKYNGEETYGINTECFSFKDGVCAEQGALGSYLSEGGNVKDIKELEIISEKDNLTPCFLCRCYLNELLDPNTKVICGSKTYKVKDLCPHPFGKEDLC